MIAGLPRRCLRLRRQWQRRLTLKRAQRRAAHGPSKEVAPTDAAASAQTARPLASLAPDLVAQIEVAAQASGLSETALRNVGFEAVRVGNYYSEDQQEVVEYIVQCFHDVLADAKFLRKNGAELRADNGLSSRYTLLEILQKRHETDGYDVFLPAEEAIAAKANAERQSAGPVDVDAGVVGELQEGLNGLAVAARGEADPIGADEVIELLEGSSKAGELGAAVYCGERLDEMHEGGVPDNLLDRTFEALKPFLRPSAARAVPRLTGPWAEAQYGKFVPNQKKHLGRLVDRLAKLRRERELRQGGAAAEKADKEAAGEKVLKRLCRRLLPLLAEDQEALSCKRRGPMAAAIVRLCREHSLQASTAVGWDVLRLLEQEGHLHCKGRVAELKIDAKSKAATAKAVAAGHDAEGSGLERFASDLKVLDSLAKERLDRKRKRMQSRQESRASKHRRSAAGGAAES